MDQLESRSAVKTVLWTGGEEATVWPVIGGGSQ